jgi:serine/arginine repetitive matrix protein 2
MSSISSLRPYAQSRGAVKPNLSKPPMSINVGQQIAPWPTSVQGLPPLKESASSSVSNATPPPSTFRLTHKRTLTPAPEPEPEPLYQPLRPAKVRVASGTLKASYSSLSTEKRGTLGDNNASNLRQAYPRPLYLHSDHLMVNSTDLSDLAVCHAASLQLHWPRMTSSL